MTTIKDIARECNVSLQTVSRVINNKPDVSPTTRSKILQHIKDVGFVPNYNARGMSSNKRFLLGYIFPLSYGSTAMHQLGEMIKNAQSHGYGLVCETLSNELPYEFDYCRKLIDNIVCYNPEGIIIDARIIEGLERETVEYLSRKKIPLSVVNAMSPITGCNVILNNINAAVDLGVNYLVNNGCEHIVFLGWTQDSGSSLYKKFISSIKAHDLDYDQDNIIDTYGIGNNKDKVDFIFNQTERLFKQKGKLGIFTPHFWLASIIEKWAIVNGKEMPNELDAITLETDEMNSALPYQLPCCITDNSIIAEKALQFIKAERANETRQIFKTEWKIEQ
ncbi:MAG: LacI family transcriptional regulator [Victivallaceae bacterium]|nr:LacI family transcriptional regulator [Victivallaceae bacterium]